MVRKNKKIKDLTSVPSNNLNDCNGILFILDEDPVKAARSLAVPDIKYTANCIAEAFTFKYLLDNAVLVENTLLSTYKPKPFIYSTVYNIEYFSQMYEELTRVYKKYSGVYLNTIPRFDAEEMLYNFNLSTYNKSKTKLNIPDYREFIKTKKNLAKYNILGIDNKANSTIDVYRLMYIVNGYALSQFPCGAPEWYSPMRREIYRRYDKLSKKTFVIMVDTDGYYRYYFSHISSKLREITDLKDLRDLIDSFLFQQD